MEALKDVIELGPDAGGSLFIDEAVLEGHCRAPRLLRQKTDI
jgi:hypothetical protein